MAVDLSGPWINSEGAFAKRVRQGLRGADTSSGRSITIVYLTSDLSHQTVLALARPQDELVCVRLFCTASLIALTNRGKREELWLLPPADLLVQLRINVFYAPEGDMTLACPGIPTVAAQSLPEHATEAAHIKAHVVAPDSDIPIALHAASARHGPLWHKGICNDGWIESTAVVALPSFEEPAQLEIHTAAIPAPRRLRLYRGHVPFGGFALPASTPNTASVVIAPGGEPLVLQIPDAANLDLDDPRRHGIQLTRIRLTSDSRQSIELY